MGIREREMQTDGWKMQEFNLPNNFTWIPGLLIIRPIITVQLCRRHIWIDIFMNEPRYTWTKEEKRRQGPMATEEEADKGIRVFILNWHDETWFSLNMHLMNKHKWCKCCGWCSVQGYFAGSSCNDFNITLLKFPEQLSFSHTSADQSLNQFWSKGCCHLVKTFTWFLAPLTPCSTGGLLAPRHLRDTFKWLEHPQWWWTAIGFRFNY